ncbi:hypothetical protein V6Z11_A04G093200 [Gossypium hirsutum]
MGYKFELDFFQVSEKDETRGWDDNARNKPFTLENKHFQGWKVKVPLAICCNSQQQLRLDWRKLL